MGTNQKNNMEEYEIFSGSIYKEIPKLIASGRRPLNCAEIMRMRLEHANSRPNDYLNDPNIKRWFYSTFSSADAVVYASDGRVKIDFDSETLRTISKKDQPNFFKSLFRKEYLRGALTLEDTVFGSISGPEFNIPEQERYARSRNETESLANKNEIFMALARGDSNLLKEYVELYFKTWKRSGGMCVGIYDNTGGKPHLRPWRLGGVVPYNERNIYYPSFGADAQSPAFYNIVVGLGIGSEGDYDDHCCFIGK
jgi:hypothetical protein